MTDLLTHIKALNAKTQAWIDEAPGRFAGIMTEDLDHWNDYGIYTAAQFDRYMDEECYHELYKSAYGIRPRNVAAMTDEELRNAIEYASKAAAEAIERDRDLDEYYAKIEAEEKAARDEQRAFDVSIMNEADRIEAMLNPAPLAWEEEAMRFGG